MHINLKIHNLLIETKPFRGLLYLILTSNFYLNGKQFIASLEKNKTHTNINLAAELHKNHPLKYKSKITKVEYYLKRGNVNINIKFNLDLLFSFLFLNLMLQYCL